MTPSDIAYDPEDVEPIDPRRAIPSEAACWDERRLALIYKQRWHRAALVCEGVSDLVNCVLNRQAAEAAEDVATTAEARAMFAAANRS